MPHAPRRGPLIGYAWLPARWLTLVGRGGRSGTARPVQCRMSPFPVQAPLGYLARRSGCKKRPFPWSREGPPCLLPAPSARHGAARMRVISKSRFRPADPVADRCRSEGSRVGAAYRLPVRQRCSTTMLALRKATSRSPGYRMTFFDTRQNRWAFTCHAPAFQGLLRPRLGSLATSAGVIIPVKGAGRTGVAATVVFKIVSPQLVSIRALLCRQEPPGLGGERRRRDQAVTGRGARSDGWWKAGLWPRTAAISASDRPRLTRQLA